MSFYDDASLVVIPSGYKASTIYAQKPLTTDGQLSFSRASTATRVNSSGLIEAVASNVPRLDYLGSTCPRLLLEPQRTNISNYNESSSAFNAATVTNAAGLLGMKAYNVEGDYSLGDAPNVPCSDLLANNTYTTSMYIDFNSLTGTQLTMSILAFFPSVEIARMTVNKSTKAITSSTSGGGIWTINTAKIEHQKDEIYRVILTATTNTNGVGARSYVDSGNNESVNVAGIQVEASSYPTSVILKTTTASVTRVADAASKTGISSLIGQTAGTIYAEWTSTNANTGGRILAISDGGFTNRIIILESSGTIRVFVSTSSVVQFDADNLGTYTGTHKIAIAYANNDLKVYLDGVAVATATTLTVPACSAAYFGTLEDGTNATALNGGIKQSLLFKTRLTNAQLAELTTL